jgi:hypothetical protein
MEEMLTAVLVLTMANIGILALNLKLYTEFAKQRMQENRPSATKEEQ